MPFVGTIRRCGDSCQEHQNPVPVVPEWPEFMRGCVRYRQWLDAQAPDAPRAHDPYEE